MSSHDPAGASTVAGLHAAAPYSSQNHIFVSGTEWQAAEAAAHV